MWSWPRDLGVKGSTQDPHLLQIVAERAVASSGLSRAAMLEPVSTDDLPLQGTIPSALPAALCAQSPPLGSGIPGSHSPLACLALSLRSPGTGQTHS